MVQVVGFCAELRPKQTGRILICSGMKIRLPLNILLHFDKMCNVNMTSTPFQRLSLLLLLENICMRQLQSSQHHKKQSLSTSQSVDTTFERPRSILLKLRPTIL